MILDSSGDKIYTLDGFIYANIAELAIVCKRTEIMRATSDFVWVIVSWNN
jgi:hypothetical protein